MEYIVNYEGKIPSASPKECGNYLDLNLNMAKYQAEQFLSRLKFFTDKNLNIQKHRNNNVFIMWFIVSR